MQFNTSRILLRTLLFVLLNFYSAVAFNKTVVNNPTKIELASLFQNHMVLQRDAKIPVWGKGEPGTKITVQFANTTKKTTVGKDGKWQVKLPSLKASFESRTMTISSAKETIEITDVVVGEVWICSGQSNMQFHVNSVPELKKLIPSAKNIRSFQVKNTVAFTPQDTCEGTWETENPSSAVAFSFAYFLEDAIDTPIGIIQTSWGSSSLEAWMPRELTAKVPHFKIMMEEFDADATTQNKIKSILEGPKPWTRNDDVFLRRQSNILYNAMMHPLIPYACRGLVWYQGERNTQSMQGMVEKPWFSRNSGMLKYGSSLQQWIHNYRDSWNQKDMDFLIVMLPGYGQILKDSPVKEMNHPNAHSWAWMRESQLKALEIPHTSVANTIDLGDVKNIHPKDKLPVGQRLALLAQRDALDLKVKASGPVFKKAKIKNNTITICFDEAKTLKTTDGKAPREFWLADDSKKWVQANAEIKGETIVLSSSKLKKPKYVRYAFTGKPNVNLVNEIDLPAYPFRTDNFKP